MGTYDSNDLSGLGNSGARRNAGIYAAEAGSRRAFPIRAGQLFAATAAPSPTPVYTAPPVYSGGDSTIAALKAQVQDLTTKLAKCRASEAALTKVIQTATHAPAPGVKPSGLQLLVAQFRATIQDLTTKITKKTASEAALTKVIQTATHAPAPGAQPTGLQALVAQFRATISQLQARIKALGG